MASWLGWAAYVLLIASPWLALALLLHKDYGAGWWLLSLLGPVGLLVAWRLPSARTPAHTGSHRTTTTETWVVPLGPPPDWDAPPPRVVRGRHRSGQIGARRPARHRVRPR